MIASGSHLGPYEVLGPLGAGGMGEVYRARDTRLGREVAIKVLPAELSADSNRLKRFEQEARSASALNHPNIVTLHDIGFEGSVSYIAMELVDGKTLRELLLAGPLPIKKLLQVAPQVADGLAKAHEAGIVHRDLKPENVMVTGDGRVKILDFGLAKMTQPDSDSVASESPTATRGTEPGIVMGTVGYMSPEQASGHAVDYRSDQFSFGSVLYEMATGKRAFEGKTKPEILAAIIRDEPQAIATVNPKVPAPLRWIVEQCLAKEPKDRYSSTEDLARDLVRVRDHLGEVSGSGEAAATPAKRSQLFWPLAVVVALLAVIVAVAYLRRTPEPARSIRSSLLLPEKMELGNLALSPDARHLAFTAGRNERYVLWIRPLEGTRAQPIQVRGDALFPFWSPDSRFVGFFSDGKLRRVDVRGGAIQTVCDAERGNGGTWGPDGTIVFSPGSTSALYRVPAAGGSPVAVTTLNQSRHETSHRYPFFLPDGRHFLYMATDLTSPLNDPPNAIRVASLDGKLDKVVEQTASSACYAAGHLLYVREGTLLARPFDLGRLETAGAPITIAREVRMGIGRASYPFGASDRLLVFLTVLHRPSTLLWIDRSGKPAGSLGDPDLFGYPRLSPDGRKVAVDIDDLARETSDVWIYDVATGARTRFGAVFGTPFNNSPVWSPEGDRIFFASDRKSRGHFSLFVKAINGAGEELLLGSPDENQPEDCSPDGRFLSFSTMPSHGKRNGQIWVLDMVGQREARPFAADASVQEDSRFSPDGRWIAYRSDESGTFEVYVRSFPGPGGKIQVSTAGGSGPRWRRDGRELYYMSLDNKIMAVPVRLEGSFHAGSPVALFSAHAVWNNGFDYDVSADGQRFLLNSPSGDESPPPLTLLTDWTALLKKD